MPLGWGVVNSNLTAYRRGEDRLAWLVEGRAKFIVGSAFYRQASQVARDLAILSAAIYQSDTGCLRVLDAMTGCGVRSLRYWLESQADWVWANEANPEISPILQQNLLLYEIKIWQIQVHSQVFLLLMTLRVIN